MIHDFIIVKRSINYVTHSSLLVELNYGDCETDSQQVHYYRVIFQVVKQEPKHVENHGEISQEELLLNLWDLENEGNTQLKD
jgi:hypothetical protein